MLFEGFLLVAGDGFEPTPFPFREGYEPNELGIQ